MKKKQYFVQLTANQRGWVEREEIPPAVLKEWKDSGERPRAIAVPLPAPIAAAPLPAVPAIPAAPAAPNVAVREVGIAHCAYYTHDASPYKGTMIAAWEVDIQGEATEDWILGKVSQDVSAS